MIMRLLPLLAAVFVLTVPALAEDPAPLDGKGRVFEDALLDNMVGKWTLSGNVMGRPATHDVDVQWILNHQFLQLHETDKEKTKGVPDYEALPTIGYDNASDRYVAHWLDIYGGRFSETLGYGVRDGNAVKFVFEYPDGPFRTTFEWWPAKKQWHWTMVQKGPDGKWQSFADMTLSRR